MSKNKNTIATPLVADAYNLHKLLFRDVYPYPLDVTIENHQLSLKIDKIWRQKYIPFLIALVTVTFAIGFNSCAFVLALKLFHRSTQINVVAIVFIVFLASCSFTECGTYIVYSKSIEFEAVLNQLFHIERTCKFFYQK